MKIDQTLRHNFLSLLSFYAMESRLIEEFWSIHPYTWAVSA